MIEKTKFGWTGSITDLPAWGRNPELGFVAALTVITKHPMKQIQDIREVIDLLLQQRTTVDQEEGTDNLKIDAAQQALDKMEAMLEPTGLAERLYTVYCEAVGGKAYDGKPLPNWADFSVDPTKKKQSEAWMAVANAIIT